MSNPDISAYVARILADAPPLTEEKRDKLTALFTAAGDAA